MKKKRTLTYTRYFLLKKYYQFALVRKHTKNPQEMHFITVLLFFAYSAWISLSASVRLAAAEIFTMAASPAGPSEEGAVSSFTCPPQPAKTNDTTRNKTNSKLFFFIYDTIFVV